MTKSIRGIGGREQGLGRERGGSRIRELGDMGKKGSEKEERREEEGERKKKRETEKGGGLGIEGPQLKFVMRLARAPGCRTPWHQLAIP